MRDYHREASVSVTAFRSGLGELEDQHLARAMSADLQ